MNRPDKHKQFIASHASAHAQAVAEKIIRAKKDTSGRDKYLACCREFGLLLRTHGLAATVCYYHDNNKDQQQRFAIDVCGVLGKQLPPANPHQIRQEAQPQYLIRSRHALQVADLFKRYGNALLGDLPDWATGDPGQDASTPPTISPETDHA